MTAIRWMTCVLACTFAPGCSLLYGGNFHVEARDAGPNDGATPDAGPIEAAVPDGGVDDGGSDASVGDGGGLDGGAVGCTAPPGSVLGSARDHFLSASSDMPAPIDLSGYTIQAILASGTVRDAVIHTGGTFQIDGVPDGETYTLKMVTRAGGTTFDVTDQRCVDLDEYVGGRADAQPVTLSQPLTLHLTNMQPWRNQDWIITEVFNTSSEGWQVDDLFDTPLAAGATSVAASYDFGNLSYGYSYRPGGRPALIQSSSGDALQIAHARRTDVLDASGRLHETFGAIDMADIAGSIAMLPGAPTSVTGTFMPIATDHMLRVTFNRPMFDAGYPDGQSRYATTTVAVYGSPFADRGISVGVPLADVVFTDFSGTAPRNLSVDTMYGDPLPVAWPRVLDQRYTRRRGFRIPGTTTRFTFRPSIIRLATFTLPLPGAPDALPPGNIQVGSQPAAPGGRVTFDGHAPIHVSWSPVATASYYRLQVHRLYTDGSATNDVITGRLQTRGTSIDLAAELFSGGEFFFLELTTVRDGGLFSQGHLRLQPFPATFAATVSGRLHLLPTCGNGTVEAPEACDPGGAVGTATCNVDCTVPLCGDGLTNTLAGESCDTAGPSDTCTMACHPPVCGDGILSPDVEDCDDGNITVEPNGCSSNCHRINTCGNGIVEDAIEDCDDGNTTDEGNGCNLACHANNICGNHIVESAIEACDSGGVYTAGCDDDCTAVVCGDFNQNNAAGEECDPPDGTTCSATCHAI